MAQAGRGDAGALAVGLRHGVTGLGLRALAAKAVHVAAAAPERMTDIYDNAAAGWLGGAVFPPRPRSPDPLTISTDCWAALWRIVEPAAGSGGPAYAPQMMRLAGELDPKINARMAAVAVEFPGVAEAAAGGLPEPFEPEALGGYGPATLGYALRQELLTPGSLAPDPYWIGALPFLRHMPWPLAHINIQVIQSMALWGLVAGYTSRTLDRVALGAS
jgi:hypothetical protein